MKNVVIALLSVVSLLLVGCMTEEEYRRRQRGEDPSPPAAAAANEGEGEQPAPASNVKVTPLDGGESLVQFYVEGFVEPDGGPRVVRRAMESRPGIMAAVYDSDSGLWRVRFVARKFTAEQVGQLAVDTAWSELRERVTVRFIE